MKRVACISTMVTPPGEADSATRLMGLYNSTRVYNRENDITGVFLVSHNSCMQVLEGTSEAIANSLYRLGRDDRIADTSVVVNVMISKPEFPNWTIRFVGDVADSHRTFLAKLLGLIREDVVIDCESDRSRFDCFFESATEPTSLNSDNSSPESARPIASLEAASKDGNSFDKCVVSLASWPRSTQLKMTPELMRLCSNLVKRPTHFERLMAMKLCSSSQLLNRHLESLKRLGLLRVHATASGPNLKIIESQKIADAAEKPADRFSSVLRRFLTSRS